MVCRAVPAREQASPDIDWCAPRAQGEEDSPSAGPPPTVAATTARAEPAHNCPGRNRRPNSTNCPGRTSAQLPGQKPPPQQHQLPGQKPSPQRHQLPGQNRRTAARAETAAPTTPTARAEPAHNCPGRGHWGALARTGRERHGDSAWCEGATEALASAPAAHGAAGGHRHGRQRLCAPSRPPRHPVGSRLWRPAADPEGHPRRAGTGGHAVPAAAGGGACRRRGRRPLALRGGGTVRLPEDRTWCDRAQRPPAESGEDRRRQGAQRS